MIISSETRKYWQETDWNDLEKAISIEELYIIAERIISRMPKPFSQVCGPIASGGLGSIEKNLEAFNNEIVKLQSKGISIFDQMPFEFPMQRLKKTMRPDECLEIIMNNFYLPIFESGNVSTFYFIKNWESSNGSKWEHEEARRLGIEIKYL